MPKNQALALWRRAGGLAPIAGFITLLPALMAGAEIVLNCNDAAEGGAACSPSRFFRVNGSSALRSNALHLSVDSLSQGERTSTEWIRLNDDGGWNWLQDERSIMAGEQLIVGSVAAGTHDPRRAGNIEAAIYHLKDYEFEVVGLIGSR